MTEFPTIAHVTLTVRDLGRSILWDQEFFGCRDQAQLERWLDRFDDVGRWS